MSKPSGETYFAWIMGLIVGAVIILFYNWTDKPSDQIPEEPRLSGGEVSLAIDQRTGHIVRLLYKGMAYVPAEEYDSLLEALKNLDPEEREKLAAKEIVVTLLEEASGTIDSTTANAKITASLTKLVGPTPTFAQVEAELDEEYKKERCAPAVKQRQMATECDGEEGFETTAVYNGDLVYSIKVWENWNYKNSNDIRAYRGKLPYIFGPKNDRKYFVMHITDSIKNHHKYLADSVLAHFKKNVKSQCN